MPEADTAATTDAPRLDHTLRQQAAGVARDDASRPLATDAAGILRLQRSAGNAAVTRLLARQPATPPTEVDEEDPYGFGTGAYSREEYEEDRRRLREPILEGLNPGNAASFLRRLREESPSVRLMLATDPLFLDAVRARLGRGRSLWAIRLALEFARTLPQAVAELHSAVHAEDPIAVINVLRANGSLTEEGRTPGVREVLQHVFAGRPELAQMEALLATRASGLANVSTPDDTEAHYEQTSTGFLGLFPSYGLKTFGGRGRYDLVRNGGELRVIVEIKLIEDDVSDPDRRITTEHITRWRDGIQGKWNRGFRATNGTDTLRIIFVPIFRLHGNAMHDVHVQREIPREDESRWALDTTAATAAHEFGHMLGLNDEYRLPATIAEAKGAGLSEIEARRSSVEGITGEVLPPREGGYSLEGIMSQNDVVLPRHVQPIVHELNARLKPPDETDFVLVAP